MNFKTTIVLLLLLLVVGITFYVVVLSEESLPPPDRFSNPEEQRGHPLFASDELSTESVNHVTIAQAGTTIEFKKEGTTWNQTKPVRFPLNTWTGSRIVNDSATLRYTERFKSGSQDAPSLDELELEPPKAVVTLKTEGDELRTHTIFLGRKGYGGRAYLMRNDDPVVYVVNDDLQKLIFDQDPTEWRAKTLRATGELEADHVTLNRDGQAIELIKAEGNWVFGMPHSGRADRDSIRTLLGSIGNMTINKFVADAPVDLLPYGLSPPSKTIVIKSSPVESNVPANQPGETGDDSLPPSIPKTATIQTLAVGGPADLKSQVYFATWSQGESPSNVIFTISSDSDEKLDKTVDDLRDPRITVVDAGDVQQMIIKKSDSEKINLERSPDGWSFSGDGPGYQADDQVVADLVSTIVEAKATSYVPNVVPNEGDLRAIVTLSVIGQAEPERLRVFNAEDDQQMILRGDETTGYRLAADIVSDLFQPILSLRNRRAVDLSPDSITKISIKHPDGVVFSFSRQAVAPATQTAATQPANTLTLGPWQLDGHDKYESSSLDELVKELFPLRVEGWLDSADTMAVSAVDHIDVSFEAVGEGHQSILIDFNRRIASIAGVDMLCQISESLFKKITAEFRDRNVLPVTIDEIASVTVMKDEVSITVKKEGSSFVNDAGDVLNEETIGKLFDTLAGLRVQRYIPEPPARSAPNVRMEIALKDGQIIHLDVFMKEGMPPEGTNDEKWFTLDAETVQTLMSDLTKPST